MGSLDEAIARDVSGKVPGAVIASAQQAAHGEGVLGAALAADGKALVVVTDDSVVIAREKAAPTIHRLTELHSISVIGPADPALFAPLYADQPFDAIAMHRVDGDRIATVARSRLVELHEPGVEWWDSPLSNLGVAIWPSGLLVRPHTSPVPERQWCTVSFANTGVQIRTGRNPQQPAVYKGDFREFIPWPSVRSVSIEGADQIERRPSVGAVVLFGVLGLGASKEIRRSYFVVETEAGDYVFERQGLLPLQLSGVLAPVLRQMGTNAATDDTTQQLLDAQLETNRLLSEILDALTRREEST